MVGSLGTIPLTSRHFLSFDATSVLFWPLLVILSHRWARYFFLSPPALFRRSEEVLPLFCQIWYCAISSLASTILHGVRYSAKRTI
jgi:hypothetical protein